MWPLSVYEIPLSTAEKMERLVSFYIRKWLGVPRCLSTVALYGKSILQLPVTSLVEEFKCTKVRTELLLSGSKDVVVSRWFQTQLGGENGIQEWQCRRQNQHLSTQRLWVMFR